MKRSRLKPISWGRKKMLSDYSKLRKQYLAANPMCKCCETAKASDIHHRRGRYGKRLNDVAFWIGVCRKCHERIHHDPAWGYANGYLLPR